MLHPRLNHFNIVASNLQDAAAQTSSAAAAISNCLDYCVLGTNHRPAVRNLQAELSALEASLAELSEEAAEVRRLLLSELTE